MASRRSATRQPRRAVHGVLLLDKPIGWTSNDALQKAKGLLRAEKAGHTGTLDPLATGLLPLCFGAATKFSQASLDADKSLPRHAAPGPAHEHRRPRRRGHRDPPGRRRPRRHRRRLRALRRHHRATAADAFGAQAPGAGAVRVRPRRRRGRARRAPRHDPPHRHRRLAVCQPGDRRRLQQGHLHPHAGRRHRRGAGLRRAPGSAAPHRQRGSGASTTQ